MSPPFSRYRHILVVSFPRSGTHVLLNTIQNNLSPDLTYKSWEYFSPTQQGVPIEGKDPPLKRKKFSPDLTCNYLIKSHASSKKEIENQIGKKILADSKLVYIHRDPFEVMRSSYYYYPTWSKRCKNIIDNSLKKGGNSFKDFISKSGLLEEWVDSTMFWLSQENVLFITFDELINDYNAALDSLSFYLSTPISADIIRPHEARFNDGAGVVSPGLTKNEFKKADFEDLINSQIERYKNEN